MSFPEKIKNPFMDLPNEVMIKIFKYMTQNHLGKIARVCRRWNALINSSIIWQKVDVQFHYTHQSQNSIFLSFLKKVPSSATSLRVKFLAKENWLQPLDFHQCCMILKQKDIKLQEMILDESIICNSQPSIIDLCTEFLPSVTNLALLYCKILDDVTTIQYTDSSNISVLNVTGLWDIKHIISPLVSRMPRLKELNISNTIINEDSLFNREFNFLDPIEILHLQHTFLIFPVFPAIKRHGFTLKELYLCGMILNDSDLVVSESELPKLKTICLKSASITCNGVVSIVKSCPSLQNIYVESGVLSNYVNHPFIIENQSKLGIVKYIDCYEHTNKVHF